MDKKIFAIWIGICVFGAVIFAYIPNTYESDTSNKLAYEKCLADNNIELDKSVFDNYAKALSELTDEDLVKYVKELIENDDASLVSKDINNSVDAEIIRWLDAKQTCQHTK